MANCFVIQPFDKGGPYDKRYGDVLVPAIRKAGLDEYRVDEDPGTVILIDDIERGIRESVICLADITTNNPNIWYEVGYALAVGKPVVLICNEPRPEPYPFDIRHRAIINYAPHSTSDFEKLKEAVSERLRKQVQNVEALQTVAAMSEMQTTEGLSPHEIAILVSIMSERYSPTSALALYVIKDKMKSSGFTPMAVGLALESLARKKMIEFSEETDYDNRENYTACRLMSKGVDWLLANQSTFNMTIKTELRDEDIPF